MIKFDVQCYKNIMSNMDSNANKELSNNFISLKSGVLIVEKFMYNFCPQLVYSV